MMANDFTIITDLGGVLITVHQQDMCEQFARYSSLSAEEIGRHFTPAVVTGFEIDLSRGLMAPQRFYELISKELRLRNLSFKDFERIYSDRFTRKEETIELLRKLGEKYLVAMLSNTNAMHYPYWSKVLGVDMNLFKELILSFQVGLMKPDKEIFLAAAKRLKVKPEQCVFIDDVKEYVNAAKKVGMRAIHFVSASQLRKDLAAAGVKV